MNSIFDKSKKSFKLAREIVEFIANIIKVFGAFLPFVLAFFGYDQLTETSSESAPLEFPLRLLLMAVCAGVIGMGLGLGITLLTKQYSSVTKGFAFLVAVLGAGLLIIVADALSLTTSKLPDFSLFVAIGMALILGVLTFFFRAGAASVTIAVVEDRAAMMVCFAATSAVVGLIVHIGRVLT